jgi:hypothetical protein
MAQQKKHQPHIETFPQSEAGEPIRIACWCEIARDHDASERMQLKEKKQTESKAG